MFAAFHHGWRALAIVPPRHCLHNSPRFIMIHHVSRSSSPSYARSLRYSLRPKLKALRYTGTLANQNTKKLFGFISRSDGDPDFSSTLQGSQVPAWFRKPCNRIATVFPTCLLAFYLSSTCGHLSPIWLRVVQLLSLFFHSCLPLPPLVPLSSPQPSPCFRLVTNLYPCLPVVDSHFLPTCLQIVFH